MVCKICGADMRIVGSRKNENDGKVYRVLVHRCMNPRCTNNAAVETCHHIGSIVNIAPEDSSEE